MIALLFVGADISAIVAQTFSHLAEIRIGDSGGLFVADGDGRLLQQHVHDAVQAMGELRQHADCTGLQAKDSQQGLAAVAQRITHVADQLTSIAATVEQQCAVTMSLTEMQQQLLGKSEQSADDARVVSASAEALGTVTLELRDAVAVFR